MSVPSRSPGHPTGRTRRRSRTSIRQKREKPPSRRSPRFQQSVASGCARRCLRASRCKLLRHVGLGGSRRHAIDRDAVIRQFLAENFRQPDHAGLGDPVCAGERQAFFPLDRRHIDDAPAQRPGSAPHARHDCPADEIHSGEVDIDDAPEIGGLLLPQRRNGAENPGVVDQDIDAAEGIINGIGGSIDRCFVSNIDGVSPMLRSKRLRALASRRSIDIPDRHARALGRQPRGNGKPDAARGARDDGVATFKPPPRIHFGKYALV